MPSFPALPCPARRSSRGSRYRTLGTLAPGCQLRTSADAPANPGPRLSLLGLLRALPSWPRSLPLLHFSPDGRVPCRYLVALRPPSRYTHLPCPVSEAFQPPSPTYLHYSPQGTQVPRHVIALRCCCCCWSRSTPSKPIAHLSCIRFLQTVTETDVCAFDGGDHGPTRMQCTHTHKHTHAHSTMHV
ncbi:hypothetical protein LZ32DRAFT_57010 [Colletotrichum eremochloae]|nr:hypothetical protein LZ32DRAFT_57010 [Colletotrichum eremochloae]